MKFGPGQFFGSWGKSMLEQSDEQATSRPKRRKGGRLKRLGPLYGDISLRLHTPHAIQVFCGRRRQGQLAAIPGINNLAKAVDGSRQRPDREAFLARVAAALADAETALCQAEVEAAAFIATLHGLSFDTARSKEPRVFDLRFRSPHSFHAARLIGRFDHLVATLMTLNHCGAISRRSLMRRIDVPMRRLRQPINVACGNGDALEQLSPDDGEQRAIVNGEHALTVVHG